MYAATQTKVIDGLAEVSLWVRRRLRTMSVTPRNRPEETRDALRGEVVQHGSSFAAFRLACTVKPRDMPDLLREVGYGDLGRQGDERAFNACVDGYAVYDDGRRRGRLS